MKLPKEYPIKYCTKVASPLLVLVAMVLVLLIPSQRLYANESVFGYWVVPGKDAVVLVARQNDSLSMRIVRTFEPTMLDHNNPKKVLQSRTLSGQTLGQGFSRRGERWVGGKIYDPASGKFYKANLSSVDSDHLLVRGYIAFPALGQSQIWIRLEQFRQNMLAMIADPIISETGSRTMQNQTQEVAQ